MMTDYDSVLSAATRLSADDRLRLIDELWATSGPTLNEEWCKEIERRSAQLDSGDVETIPWETVREEALRRLRNHREV